ncbi:MAG TPA: 6-phosphofructokinase [Candidatus Saccharimonadia bacterium]|nr:6-phosphofructokinase [Candidatus Saccharimonadia bacterium]
MESLMATGNLLYAQSGGVTAVINATAAGVIETAKKHRATIGRVYAAKNGIIGALREQLFDASAESAASIKALRHTPGGAFGSCRFKLKGIDESRAQYQRLIDVFRAHDIRWFLYNGGNDSADTAHKISQISVELDYPIACIGVPKTVDNDLAVTDNCPGFGSVAKYTAISIMEASLDVESMFESSTKVFVMEVMGRHAGWIAAAAGLAGKKPNDPPQIILFPEVPFDEAKFLAAVAKSVEKNGYCSVVVSEGLRTPDGKFLAEAGSKDAFGHVQLGGVGPRIASLVKEKLGFKYHWAVSDYLQRSARHIASATDAEQAYAVGKAAVEYAVEGLNAVMPVIKRTSQEPYTWTIEAAPLSKVANHEKFMPKSYIRADGFGITGKCREYLEPLIRGEDYPPYGADGLPQYVRLYNKLVPKKLPPFRIEDK